MEKIKWCLNIKKGLEIVEPSDNLAKIYLKKSEDALKAAASLKGNRDWEISSLYYSIYFALYSVLMKIGIKSENHSCTIEFMKAFLKSYFDEKDVTLLEKSLKARVDAQYYVDRKVSDKDYKRMLENAPSFLVKCKEIVQNITQEEIEITRDELKII